MEDPRRPSQPGWYQDPFGTRPEDQRYWDGETWLAAAPEQQQQSFPQQAPPPGGQPATPTSYQQGAQPQWPQPQQFQQPGWQHPEGGQWQRAVPTAPTTPDGVPTASWGRRFGAYLIDGVIVAILLLIAGAVLGVWSSFSELLTSIDPTATQAEVTELTAQFVADNAGIMAAFFIINTLISAAYHITLTATSGRTIGKRVLGIRVRKFDVEQVPGFAAATLRWLVHFGLPSLLGGLPGIGFLLAIFPFLDGLWPLWDPRRQALHDKAARTVVVRD